MYALVFDQEWPSHFNKLDHSVKERVVKKIKKIIEHPQKRHLKKGVNYFVGEVGQHRILFRVFEETKEIRFYFVGPHKEYEKWYSRYF